MMRILAATGSLSCLAVLASPLGAQAPAVSRMFWSGKSGGFAVEWSATNLKAMRTSDGKPAFDAAAMAKAAWTALTRDAKGETMRAEFTYRLLSFAGPYLSVEESAFCDCGGAHPSASKRIRSVRLDGGSIAEPSPATLTAIFPEPVIFSALIADPALSKVLRSPRPTALKQLLAQLDDLTIRVKDCDYGLGEELLSSFAFYAIQDGNVFVRLGLPSADEVCRGQMTQLGLSLPIPEERRSLLLDAKERRAGLLVVNAPKSAATSFRFTQKGRGKR